MLNYLNKLNSANETPKWIVDNPYIRKWFRPSNLNHFECLCSMFTIHNQTSNIWTHLFGLFISHYYVYYRFPSHLINSIDILFMSITYTGITISYYCSILYHIFNIGSSYEFSCFLTRLDYFGIIFHLIGCMLTLVYFVYYHHSSFIQFGYVLMFIIIGSICLLMNYYSMFTSIVNTNMNGWKRTLIFVLVAALSLPPQLKICWNYPLKIVSFVLMTDFSYLLAGLIYSLKYPERLFPGHCDLFSSHAIFHIIIIIAGIGSMHSLSMISYYQINMTKLY
ncbi:hypothetical protein DERP_013131 [Dermatophagoides pteronyssinus]|uniref:Progestin and adipoQ receptor family member 3-like n=1 Tax=Dermatophagoides pteronyssinus TaxID=6956 RepID=A0ABQ8J656_DERPT|nr:hypothetical protein DERP_013131 [Dermatophagoides pteronyssinus]